jgi:hypothetical protein
LQSLPVKGFPPQSAKTKKHVKTQKNTVHAILLSRFPETGWFRNPRRHRLKK